VKHRSVIDVLNYDVREKIRSFIIASKLN